MPLDNTRLLVKVECCSPLVLISLSATTSLPQPRHIFDRAYLITDMQSRKSGIVASGATAVSVLLKRSEDGLDKTLYVGNVGDSRAILVTSKPKNE